MFITACNERGNSPQRVRHTFIHKEPRYQKLHGAIDSGRPSASPGSATSAFTNQKVKGQGIWSQVKTASVSKWGPQLVAPPDQ